MSAGSPEPPSPTPPAQPPSPAGPHERPPIASMPLSVVLVADGPPAGVGEAVTAWAAYLGAFARAYEILWASDSTDPAAGELAVRTPHLTRLVAKTPGFGACLREGIEAAR